MTDRSGEEQDAFGFDFEPGPITWTSAIEALSERVELAILEGDDDDVRRVVAEGSARLSEYLGAAWELLMLAVEEGRVAAVAALLEIGVPVDFEDENGGTVLMKAVWNGHLEIAGMLLGAGANPNATAAESESYGDPRRSGLCALSFALYKGHRALVELLEPITHPDLRVRAQRSAARRHAWDAANPPRFSEATTRLFMSAQQGHLDRLCEAIDAGADLDAVLEPEASNRLLGSTPLSFAAGRGQRELVDLLLEAGADPWLANHQGLLAADFAALNGHLELAGSLRNEPHKPHRNHGDPPKPS